MSENNNIVDKRADDNKSDTTVEMPEQTDVVTVQMPYCPFVDCKRHTKRPFKTYEAHRRHHLAMHATVEECNVAVRKHNRLLHQYLGKEEPGYDIDAMIYEDKAGRKYDICKWDGCHKTILRKEDGRGDVSEAYYEHMRKHFDGCKNRVGPAKMSGGHQPKEKGGKFRPEFDVFEQEDEVFNNACREAHRRYRRLQDPWEEQMRKEKQQMEAIRQQIRDEKAAYWRWRECVLNQQTPPINKQRCNFDRAVIDGDLNALAIKRYKKKYGAPKYMETNEKRKNPYDKETVEQIKQMNRDNQKQEPRRVTLTSQDDVNKSNLRYNKWVSNLPKGGRIIVKANGKQNRISRK